MVKIGLGKGFYILHPETAEEHVEISEMMKNGQVIIKDASLLTSGKSDAMTLLKPVLFIFSENGYEEAPVGSSVSTTASVEV